MGRLTRIRWNRAGRLAGVGAAALATVVAVPALLRPEGPPPLDPDIGLATLGDAVDVAPAPVERPRLRPQVVHRRRADGRSSGPAHESREQVPHARTDHRRAGGEASAPASAIAVVAPPVTPTPPASVIRPASPPAAPGGEREGGRGNGGPTEFGFEH